MKELLKLFARWRYVIVVTVYSHSVNGGGQFLWQKANSAAPSPPRRTKTPPPINKKWQVRC